MAAGDIALIGFGADAKSFAFVLLADSMAGQTVYFTDNGWFSTGSFRATEGVVAVTIPAGTTVGTVITVSSINTAGLTAVTSGGAAVPVIRTGSADPSQSGDQFIAYTGSAASPSFLFAIDFADGNTSWAATATSSNNSGVPTGLTVGTTALAFGPDNGAYVGPTSGTRSEILANIANPANWSFSETTGLAYSGAFAVDGDGTPGALSIGDASVVEGDSGTTAITFTVTRSGGSDGVVGAAYGISFGTAGSADFAAGQAFTGTLSFADGELTKTITLQVAADLVRESDETFTVALSAPTGGALLADAEATGTIRNDDPLVLRIFEIQGEGHRSDQDGVLVATSGIVTGVVGNGFYLQDADGDANSRTSDGIFVFTGRAPAVAVGDAVMVRGTVDEFTPGATGLSITQILVSSPSDVLVGTRGNVLPDAVLIGAGGLAPPTETIDDDGLTSFDPATDGIDFYETLEGMRVTIDSPIAVSNTNGFGETDVVASGGAGATGFNSRGGITISDGDYNPEKIQIDATSALFAGYTPAHSQGDRLGDVTGIMSYSFNNYELLVTEAVTVVADVSLPRESTTLAGDRDHLTVASYNVENLDPTDGPLKFNLLASDIVYSLAAPDIVALQEVQDADGAGNGPNLSGYVTAQLLIDAISAMGGPQYVYIEIAPTVPGTTGGEPGGNIRNGYLFNPDRVSYVDGSAFLIEGAAFDGSRKPLVADFTFNGETVRLINVHFTSRGGSDPLWGATQPPADAGDAARAAQGAAVAAYVNEALTDPSINLGVVGDFNGFWFEDNVTQLEGGVLTNLQRLLPEEERYSYSFGGNLQALENFLVSGGLLDAAEFDIVHINAEQLANAARATDHDPTVARFRIERPNEAPVAVDDLVEVNEDGTTDNLWNLLLANDSDPDPEDTHAIVAVDGSGALGSLVFDAESRTLVYVADGDAFDALAPGQTVVDSFTYTVTDQHGLTDTGTVSVTVTGIDDGTSLDGGNGKDELSGTAGEDILSGGNGTDTLYGLAGHDALFGGNGGDHLLGGIGNDLLVGGHGSDLLEGGAGADVFRVGPGDGTDRIVDFQTGVDTIDLAAIDANSSAAGNQSFTFIGSAAFSKVAGELRVSTIGADSWVQGDLNGDGTADFAIVLAGAVTPLASDFIL